ncbi:hypothetical protein [Sulfitobacter sp. JB4-11]|uniref:hypothetical protein n=1 Tax=Sulfitobacter rhodophyticola TaxID=3238304 RepID=UPI00351600F8
MVRTTFSMLMVFLTVAGCTPPLDENACACERAQFGCPDVPTDGGVGLPDYPGC